MKKKTFLIFSIFLLSIITMISLGSNTTYAATLGQRITAPEKGWRRYDNANKQIIYHDMIQRTKDISDSYSATDAYGRTNSKITFEFYGTKLRLFGYIYYCASENIKITIDGVSETFSCYYKNITSRRGQALEYEKTGLTLGKHYVTIENLSTSNLYYFDALDIDSDGYLTDVDSDAISLNQSSLNINVGNSYKLSAVTTPPTAEIIWTSTDKNIVSVDSNGNITGLKKGTVAVICQLKGTDLKAICNITVVDTTTTSNSDSNLIIELVNNNIKEYKLTPTEIESFIQWFKNRDKDPNLSLFYEFNTPTGKDYVIHDKIAFFSIK